MKTKLTILAFALSCAAVPASAFNFNFGDIGKALETLTKVKDATTAFTAPQEIELGEGVASNLLSAPHRC